MNKAIEHLNANTVKIDGIDMIPVVEAYKAIEMSVDFQLETAMSTLQGTLSNLGITVTELEQDDENLSRSAEIDI